jgi:transketolase
MTKSQRTAYGQALVDLGVENKDIVVLEADLGKSTMGHMFEVAYPERFYEMGIAEANMASVAAGLSLTGKIPFMASFAVFCPGRCYDQIRTNICIPSLNVKICGSSAGLSDYGDGSTHQSIDDISLMKVLPNMQVFSPVDAVEASQVACRSTYAQGVVSRKDMG